MALKLVKDFRPDGHAYFKDERERWYIADCSGETPTDTDDGPLILNFQEPLIVDRLSVPLTDGAFVASGKEAQFILDLYRFGASIRAVANYCECDPDIGFQCRTHYAG